MWTAGVQAPRRGCTEQLTTAGRTARKELRRAAGTDFGNARGLFVANSTHLPFEIRTDRQADRLLIGLSGELDASIDLASWGEVLRTLEAHELSQVTLDMSGLVFIDSRGLSLLLDLRNRCEQQGCELVLQAVSGQPLRTLDTVGLIDTFSRAAPHSSVDEEPFHLPRPPQAPGGLGLPFSAPPPSSIP
jgi:anti-sigma B factor antagonist